MLADGQFYRTKAVSEAKKMFRMSLLFRPVLNGNHSKDRASQVSLVVKNLPASAGDAGDTGSVPGLGRPTLVFLPGKSHRERSLAGSGGSPSQDRKELDVTEAT